jgi:AAA+ ATPase superfamily predicted ATPase
MKNSFRFVTRKLELQFLNEKWDTDQAQLIVLYGKRRVGKTELSVQFIKDKPHIYFLCERLAVSYQLKKFTETVAEYFKDEFLPADGFRDWETALKYLAHKNERIVLVIDEFPYLADSDKSIPSAFQKAWDLYLKDSRVYLILLGSSISMMEKTVLSYKAPLYGRRTGQFLIKPFGFKELKEFFPSKSFEEILSVYSVVGGAPQYLNKFQGKNYLDAIEKEILRKGEPLYEEVEFLLREELKEPRNYFAILLAISLGKHKLSEIINETGFDKGIVSRYLSILDSIQITKKEIPVTEKVPEKSRKGIYRIDDNFVRFWFRFVFRNRSLLEENRIDKVILEVREAMPSLLAENYERIACEVFMDVLIAGRDEAYPLAGLEYCGRWWNKTGEIDLVAINSRTNEIIFGEVKWSNKPVGTNIYEELKRTSQAVDWGKQDRKEYFVLFSKSGFTPAMKAKAKKERVYLFHKDKLL